MQNNKRVLVVEDEVDFLNLLSDHLKIAGFEVDKAEDGEQAIKLLLDHTPDLVLLDILLPKLDGMQVLERIRQYPDPKVSATPVIILSNLWSDKDILAAKSLKIEEYFVKTHTDLADVYKKVASVLDRA